MDLAEQIAQMTNHLDFSQVCNAVFTAHYPMDFQVIDGTRADQGNDGYVLSECQMLAYHCPTKPEQKTDKKFIKKITSDLNKAHKLHLENDYDVQKWAFVTPRPLSNPVVIQLRKQAEALGIEAISLDATFLADVLLRNRELLHRFPFLHIISIDETISQLAEALRKNEQPHPSHAETPINIEKPKKRSSDFKHVIEIRGKEQTADSKTQLRSIFYKSTDLYAQANAVLGLLQWFDPIEDNLADMVDWCDRGLSIVQQLGDKGREAYLHGEKGFFLSAMYTMEDMDTYFSIQAGNTIGVQTITEDERQGVITRLRHLEESFTNEFNTALEIIRKIDDLEMWGEVLLFIGNSAGQRALQFKTSGLHDLAGKEKDTCINSLTTAKNAFAKCDKELKVGYAVFALANTIRLLGEEKEALELVNEAKKIADTHNDFRLEQGTRLLRETIESGKIPDYVHGERREMKK